MCVKVEENNLECYVKHHIQTFIVAVRISKTAPSEYSTQLNEFKRQDNEEKLNNRRGNAMYGECVR